MNIGFIEALNFAAFNCVVFHDVDMLPTVSDDGGDDDDNSHLL